MRQELEAEVISESVEPVISTSATQKSEIQRSGFQNQQLTLESKE